MPAEYERKAADQGEAHLAIPGNAPGTLRSLHSLSRVTMAAERLHIFFNVRTATLHGIHVINMTLVPVEPHQVNTAIHTETTLAANNPAPHSGGNGAAFGTRNSTLSCFNPERPEMIRINDEEAGDKQCISGGEGRPDGQWASGSGFLQVRIHQKHPD